MAKKNPKAKTNKTKQQQTNKTKRKTKTKKYVTDVELKLYAFLNDD